MRKKIKKRLDNKTHGILRYFYKDLPTAKKCKQCRYLWCRYALFCDIISMAWGEKRREIMDEKFGKDKFMGWFGKGKLGFRNMIDIDDNILVEDPHSDRTLTFDCPFIYTDLRDCPYYKAWDDWGFWSNLKFKIKMGWLKFLKWSEENE